MRSIVINMALPRANLPLRDNLRILNTPRRYIRDWRPRRILGSGGPVYIAILLANISPGRIVL